MRYVQEKDKAEHEAFVEQMKWLPENLGERILGLFEEMEGLETLEAKVAKDADYIECAFQANIYLKQGNPWLQNWLDNVSGALRTES